MPAQLPDLVQSIHKKQVAVFNFFQASPLASIGYTLLKKIIQVR